MDTDPAVAMKLAGLVFTGIHTDNSEPEGTLDVTMEFSFGRFSNNNKETIRGRVMDSRGKQYWIDKCKELPVGKQARSVCCGSDPSRVLKHTHECYVSFCFRPDCPTYRENKSGLQRLTGERCKEIREEIKNFTVPKDTLYDVTKFPESAVAWLTKAGLHVDVWEKYKFGYSPSYHRVVIPIWMNGKKVGATCRALVDSDIKYLMGTNVKGAIFTAQKQPYSRQVVVTEDILSCIRIKEAIPQVDVICILGTSVMMERALWIVKNYSHAHFWLDGDKAGIVSTEKWTEKLKAYMDVTQSNFDGFDPKHFEDEEIRDIITTDVGHKLYEEV